MLGTLQEGWALLSCLVAGTRWGGGGSKGTVLWKLRRRGQRPVRAPGRVEGLGRPNTLGSGGEKDGRLRP